MFTWICPQCGREVPPAYTECPDCAAKKAGIVPPVLPAATAGSPLGPAAPPQQPLEPAPPPSFAPPPPVPAAAPPYQPPAPPPPVYQPSQAQSPLFAPPPAAPPPAQRQGTHLPTWLLTVLFAVLFVGLGGGAYWFFTRTPKPSTTVESSAAKPGAPQHPYQKYVEITGVRFVLDKNKIDVRFLVVNHSDSDMVGLGGNATLWARTQKSEEDPVGTFTFQTSMGGGESKELTMPLQTKLKPMELPDWQNITVDLQITAPKVL